MFPKFIIITIFSFFIGFILSCKSCYEVSGKNPGLSQEDFQKLKALPADKKLRDLKDNEEAEAIKLLRKAVNVMLSDNLVKSTCNILKARFETAPNRGKFEIYDLDECIAKSREKMTKAKTEFMNDDIIKAKLADFMPIDVGMEAAIFQAVFSFFVGKNIEELKSINLKNEEEQKAKERLKELGIEAAKLDEELARLTELQIHIKILPME